MAVAYQMPVRTELAAKVGPRMFRKTILRAGKIAKNGYEVDIDRPYLETLVRNFTAGAMDAVPFQLADELNRHNADPTRTRGKLAGLELTSNDELVGIFETTDDGAKLLDSVPYLGCSVSIDPQFKRADGRDTGPTLLHVAGTVDPEVSKLGDWVALSNEYEQVIDLTAPPESPAEAVVKQENTEPAAGGIEPEGDPVASLTDEQIQKLLKLVEDDGSAPAADAKTEDKADEEPEFTDAELAAMATPAQEADTAEAEAPELIAASADHSEALNLANARIDAQQVELAKLRRERDTERFNSEKDQLIRNFALPADVVELARPLLEGSEHRLELSSGKQVDAGSVMRNVLHELGRRFKALDLGAEYGTAEAQDDAARKQQDLEDFVTRYNSQLGR